MKQHPTDLHLEGLLDQDPDRRKILLHIAECDRCRARLAAIWRGLRSRDSSGSEEDLDEPDPAQAIRESRAHPFALLLWQERNGALELFARLCREWVAQRYSLIRSDPRFRTWGLFELLVERSLATVTQDPGFAEELGALALSLSERFEGTLYGTHAVEDLRARAWAHIGNAQRVRSDLAGAHQAFAYARDHLRKGTQDPVELAILLDLEASLKKDQRYFHDACCLLRKVVRIFLRHGDRHRAGRSLVKLSTVHHAASNLEDALVMLRRSLDLLDLEREPRLRLYAQHNLISYLTEAGRFAEAREVYQDARPLYREFPEPWAQSRRKWVRGRILRGLGHAARAESLLLAARDGFLDEGVPYDTALVSLEIATLYAEQGRTAELKCLAEEMLPIFSSLHIHREALAALSFLVGAIETETATLEVVQGVERYLRRAAHRPELRFPEPES